MSTPGQRADLWTCRRDLLAIASELCDTVEVLDAGFVNDAGHRLCQASDRLCAVLLQFREVTRGKA